VSGDEQNNKPVQVCSEEDAKNRLLKKLAAIAERAMERAGKGDDPVVDEGAVDEDGVLVEESLPRKNMMPPNSYQSIHLYFS
jgi:hypothetical protein